MKSESAVVLFADISGSTQLYETLGDTQAMETIGKCISVLSQAVTDNSGIVIKTIGVEVLATFNGVEAALSAAASILQSVGQAFPDGSTKIEVSIGLHFGQVLVEEGDVVEAGQVVARLDHDRLALELMRATANLRRFENDFKRNQELHRKDLISSETFEKSRFDMDSENATYNMAKLELGYADVRSPIGGVISERMVKVGTLVNLYQTLFKVASFDPLLAVIFVPERELSTLRQGQTA
ncbi:MAG: efflux RND transporter periplasmic adaptor subunit, partial [Acidobacteria bacterium]|nr:efflux RND transporter periplasmic adaptor subunit [Acidobacteriota bacterium]